MEKNIRIKLKTERREVFNSLFKNFENQLSEYFEDSSEENKIESECFEMNTEGKLIDSDARVEISYEETELTGMDGSHTSVSFERSAPELITIMRSGTVNTVLVCEPHKRHLCMYNTPYMPFEICVYTLNVENTLLENGKLVLEYIVEIRGAQAEKTKLFFDITEDVKMPQI